MQTIQNGTERLRTAWDTSFLQDVNWLILFPDAGYNTGCQEQGKCPIQSNPSSALTNQPTRRRAGTTIPEPLMSPDWLPPWCTSISPSVRVEHVGSTSVPGCAGKGIVDLMIAVADGEMAAVKELLDRLGFQGQIGRDPFPETRPMRAGSFVHDGETFLVHVHVIPASSPEVDDMRFFRTCLRADPELLQAYVARKREIIASGVTDSLEYCRIKGEFIKEMLG